MTTNLHHILQNLATAIDKPVLDDPRLDFTPSARYFPLIGSQSHLDTTSNWTWDAMTPFNKEAKIPLKLRESEIQVTIGTVSWNDNVSYVATRSHTPIRRLSPLFIADAIIESVTDPANPNGFKSIIRLIEQPKPNISLISWLAAYGIDATINPSSLISESFKTSHKLDHKISNEVHLGVFLSGNAQLARSLDPDRNPDILKSRTAELLAGNKVIALPPRTSEPIFASGIKIDIDQKQAVLAALRGDNFVLLGPPGCGKTQTIAAIILNMTNSYPEIKIGVASPVAAALNALRRLTGDTDLPYLEYQLGKSHHPENVDLLIVDEASRTTTAEAFPFAAKATQLIIIGDPNQTPPPAAAPRLDANDTSLMDRALRNPNFSRHELRNHYRSFHPDLLTFSNGFVYNGRLRVVPAPRREDNEGLCINYIPSAFAHSGHHSTKNFIEANALAKELVRNAIEANSRGISRSRMAVGWTYAQADLIEAAIKAELKRSKLHSDILSTIDREPFMVYTANEVQGQERDETWISLGHGTDRGTRKLAYARQPNIDMSNGVIQKFNVLMTRSRISTQVFHSILPSSLLKADSSSELAGLLSLTSTELASAHTRYQITPVNEPNDVAQRRALRDPTMPNPEAVNLASVFGVKDISDPHEHWRYGLFRGRPEWSSEEKETFRAMLIAKGWTLHNY